MFTVKKKALTPNIIWDVGNNKPLCKFVKGVIETDDEKLVEKLKELGHEVIGEADAKTFDDMTVKELTAYAVEKNIDLGKATKKPEILELIKMAEVTK